VRSTRLRHVGFALVLAEVALGCPAPVSHTTTYVAPVRGSVIGLDGAPSADTRVVAAGIETAGQPCTHVLAETRTDAKGTFEIPAIRKTYRVTWIVPGLDVIEPRYLLCVSVADTLRPAFAGSGSLNGSVDTESLGCIEWVWRDVTRVSCDSRRQNAW
jgi:hypothetical protein